MGGMEGLEVETTLALIRKAVMVETAQWHKKIEQLALSGLVTPDQLKKFSNNRARKEKWLIYENGNNGGLDLPAQFEPAYGCIPCSSMRNHGVAWEVVVGSREVWLATARRVNEDWDPVSDFGHESTHASFAPVPLFVQGDKISNFSLAAIAADSELSAENSAVLIYWLSELVLAIIH